ncbi:predicted protein [Nematostella vectensis]|uniref:Creatinase n=1 Tax=Nematostella vectensis TaxID=45351 RepID=A7S5W0_NEMVE|nr:predicted protein [Nematostella vectensis]|eukprot:XP_001632936.1 predicted protein [Nematostella vectensis]
MERRVRMLREHMAAESLDACVLTSYHNINYYSGFLYCYFGRSYATVVTHDDITTVSANIDYGQPWRRCYGDNITYTDWQKDNYYHVINQLVGGVKRVGVEFDHLNLVSKEKLQQAMPLAEQVDVGTPTMRMRMLKSAEEIAHIKQGAAVCDVGGRAGADAIGDGVPEYEVALASTSAMVRDIANRYPHAELMDTWTWFQSGINTDGAHNPVTSRRVKKGDILNMNSFSMISGYYTALERTMFYDRVPSDRHMKLWEINVKVHEKGMEVIKPGKRCCDIARELNEIFLQHDLLQYRTFGYGHSFGVLCHYYGREAGLELREDVETVLEPNMVVSIEPMLTIPEGQEGAGGYREHDILVITEAGNENITKFPYGPEHNVIKK